MTWLAVGILGCILGVAVTVGAERTGYLERALRSLGLPPPARIACPACREAEADLAGELDLARSRIEELEKMIAGLLAERAGGREAAAEAARLASEIETLRGERDRFEAQSLVERERRRAMEERTGSGSSPAPAPLKASVLSARPDLALVAIDRGRGQGVGLGHEFCPPAGTASPARVIIDEVRQEISIGQVVPSSAAADLPVGSVLVEKRP